MVVLFQKTIPILRIFDVEKAKEFYVDYLGYRQTAGCYVEVRGRPDH
jgi:hypothetical protein